MGVTLGSASKYPEEIRWINQARAGDDEAFGRVVESFQGPVFNLCYRMLGDPAEAEDAAQETFLKAYRNLKRYDPSRKFINWVLAIASNHCVDRLRKRRMTLVSLDTITPWKAPVDRSPTLEGWAVRSESEEEIRTLLEHLGDQDRAAIVLRYWYDMSYAEIAEALDLSESAVKSRLHRARRELAEDMLESDLMNPALEGRRNEAPTLQ
jgi:RNA polymerase sigma-70 factor (ECF subfamily)